MNAILFDLDDTLHNKSSTLRLMAALQHENFRLSDHGVTQAAWCEHYVQLHNIKMPKNEVFAELTSLFSLPHARADELFVEFDRECGRHAQSFPGMMTLLETSRELGAVLGCVTNGRDHMQRSKLDGLGISSLFGAIITSGGFGKKKPDPSIFDHCLSELGVERNGAIVVGDSFDADMQPAIDLGMHAIWKSDCVHQSVSFASDSLHEIRAYLCNLLDQS